MDKMISNKRRSKGRKQGQMEMIGLVVIVILLTLGMLFMAQFALKSKPHKKIFTRKGLASSTMASLMKTTIPECNNQRNLRIEEDFLEDCAANHYGDECFSCEKHCEGLHSCDFLKVIIPELLNQTLGKWNKRYEFSSRLQAEEEPFLIVLSDRGGCQKRERDTSGEFYLNTARGIAESVLYICD